MTDDKRAAIAFICGIKFISRNINYLYDCTRNKYCFYILQHVDKNQISVYDFDTKNIIMGRLPQQCLEAALYCLARLHQCNG